MSETTFWGSQMSFFDVSQKIIIFDFFDQTCPCAFLRLELQSGGREWYHWMRLDEICPGKLFRTKSTDKKSHYKQKRTQKSYRGPLIFFSPTSSRVFPYYSYNIRNMFYESNDPLKIFSKTSCVPNPSSISLICS